MLVHNIKVYISHKFSFFSSKSIDHLLSIEAAFCPPICINLGLDFEHDSEQVSLTEVVSLSVSCINESRSASYPGFTYITCTINCVNYMSEREGTSGVGRRGLRDLMMGRRHQCQADELHDWLLMEEPKH